MKPVIVGTAGHIDHGKTALVKALTGIDADRLAEEKRRGITIDIGFAHLELAAPNGEKIRIGFVDVPGHERFVRNMLAGVGGIDLVLLVIAADESIKPQTREHFEICKLLNIRRGLTVLTKSDTVDPETLEVVRLEVEEFVRGSFLEGTPVVPVSSLTGDGIPELKQKLAELAATVTPKNSAAAFRLPIDRVFTMKGFGTVVTGTLLSGSIRKEAEVEALPGGRRLRVRGIQVHGDAAEQAVAGQRTAINVAGASTQELSRGMELVLPDTLRATRRADVEVTLLAGTRPLRDRTRVHLHVHTAETVAEIVLPKQPASVGGEDGTAVKREPEIAPGESAFAQLRLAEPLLLLPGDRFIIRQFSPVVTIGGGRVLDAAPLSRRAVSAEAQREFLNTVATGSDRDILVARITRRGSTGLSMADAIAETGWRKGDVETNAAKVIAEKKITRLGDTFVAAPVFRDLTTAAVNQTKAFHEKNPLVAGISKEELRGQLALSQEVFGGVLEALLRERKLEASGEQIRLPGRGVLLKDEEAESMRQIEQAFIRAGLKTPALNEVLAGLEIDRTRAQKLVTLLLRDRVLVKVSDELVFHRETLDTLKKQVAAHKAKSPNIDVTTFKDMFGVTRKYAIPLLEWLDRERVTRRVGDARQIL